MTRSVALAVGLLVLTGCGDDATPRPDREALVAVDDALLAGVAADLQQRPGVVCVDAFLDASGLPYALPGEPAVLARTEGLDAGARDALVRETARAVWQAGLTSLVSLRVEVAAPDGTSDLGAVLQGRAGRVDADVLAADLGPRPTVAAPPSGAAPEVTGC